jgi:hypothetical protein
MGLLFAVKNTKKDGSSDRSKKLLTLRPNHLPDEIN